MTLPTSDHALLCQHGSRAIYDKLRKGKGIQKEDDE